MDKKIETLRKLNLPINAAIIAMFVLLLTACGASGDHSFDTMHPCAAPCWHGLEPGKSTHAEVLTVLQQLPFVDQKSMHETNAVSPNNKNTKEITYNCIYQDKDECRNLSFYFDQEKLTSIFITPAYLLTFGDAVQQLGNPDYVYYYPRGADDLSCSISVKWIKQSVEVASDYTDGYLCPAVGEKVRSDINIVYLGYFQKDDADAKSCNIGKSCHPWVGLVDH